ncbi:PepSY-like domain-containing protein [Flavobacterium sp. AG291]|uniref:PepSY-like domain-containing protein n=1 Tax=Flavobacterium sp. AG291 TaxID=2184000 RepID=UPI000E0B9D58|nr:PepSY-like domain-containing protein [Flavobacterium sp. AG291]RDI09806.1 putative PepSY-like beta-lactamase-inhibitor [Flavobacterium sp. AG291]
MKLLLSAAALFILLSAKGQEKETVYRSELPSSVRSFLTHFKSPLHHAMRIYDETKTTYGIVLNDNTEIQFSDKGFWTIIDGKGKPVQYKFLGKTFTEYFKTNFANTIVNRIERSESRCKVMLSNGSAFSFALDAKGSAILN